MKTIKPGVLPETKLYRATCVRCGCIMEFTRGEAQQVSGGRNDEYLKVGCPTCHREVWVDL